MPKTLSRLKDQYDLIHPNLFNNLLVYKVYKVAASPLKVHQVCKCPSDRIYGTLSRPAAGAAVKKRPASVQKTLKTL